MALAELRVGFAREMDVGEVKVLVGQTKKGYFAVGAKCTHYGAPLQTGALCDERVTCPWHGACFNVHSGDIEEAPALNALPVYATRVEGDALIVRAAQSEANKKSFRMQTMAKPDPNDKRTFVIVGGGAAAYAAHTHFCTAAAPVSLIVRVIRCAAGRVARCVLRAV